jgi:type IV secretion system protein VirB9
VALAALAALAGSGPGLVAAQTLGPGLSVPISGPLDSRVRVFAYSRDVVYTLPVTVGMHTHIELGPDEVLTEKPKLGETVQWSVSGNEKNLYVKALKERTSTSMTLVTDKRSYQFELVATTSPASRIQKAYFTYPEEEEKFAFERKARVQAEADATQREMQRRKDQELAPAALDPSQLNFAYRVDGDADFKPTAVFDNGTFTWMRLPKSQDLPAVFMVDADKKLMPVNYTVADRRGNGDRDQIIIERTAPHWVLKLGKAEVRVTADK